MAGYTKLFSSIIHSTIWREPHHVRVVWITLLAMADRDGDVEASVPGLADAARVTRAECEDALRVLEAPDPDSRDAENEGRRIAKVPGGWQLLNHHKYRDRLSEDDRRRANADRQARHRDRLKSNAYSNAPALLVTTSNTDNAGVTQSNTPDPDPEAEKRKTTIDPSSNTLSSGSLKVYLAIRKFDPWVGYPDEQAKLTAVRLWTYYHEKIDVVDTVNRAACAWAPDRSLFDRGGLHSYLASWCSNEASRADKAKPEQRVWSPGEQLLDAVTRNHAVTGQWLAQRVNTCVEDGLRLSARVEQTIERMARAGRLELGSTGKVVLWDWDGAVTFSELVEPPPKQLTDTEALEIQKKIEDLLQKTGLVDAT